MILFNKVFVVTGSGSGIGREMALLLISKGARVAGVDRNEAGLKGTLELAKENSNRLSLHTVDITDFESVAKLPDEIIKIHGQIDGLINNAGIIQKFIALESMSMDYIEKIMNVNFYGALKLIKTFLPFLEERTESIIVNVSSMGGFLPVPEQTLYGASKAALKMLTEGLQSELADSSVRVMLVMPGGVSSTIMETAGIDTKKLMTSKLAKTYKMLTPYKAAKKIIRGIEHNRRRLIIGIDAKAMDMLYRINPRFASFVMRRALNVKRYL